MFEKELKRLVDYLIKRLKDDPNWRFAWKNTYSDESSTDHLIDVETKIGDLRIRVWMSTFLASSGYNTFILVEDTVDKYEGSLDSMDYSEASELGSLLAGKGKVTESMGAFYDKLTGICGKPGDPENINVFNDVNIKKK